MKDLLLMLIPAIAGYVSCYLFRRQDYEAGRIAGANEERSWRNRIVIRAVYRARADGIIYGCENHAALMSRRAGNVSGTPISQPVGGHMTPSGRKPRANNSAAPAMQGAPLSKLN